MISERHRHRFEVNPEYLPMLEKAGFVVSGVYTERNLVDVGEIAGHPFMVGSQFHPEFKSRPVAPHPLFKDFMQAVRVHAEMRKVVQATSNGSDGGVKVDVEHSQPGPGAGSGSEAEPRTGAPAPESAEFVTEN